MRIKMVCDDRPLSEVANEFLVPKKAQKVSGKNKQDFSKEVQQQIAVGLLCYAAGRSLRDNFAVR